MKHLLGAVITVGILAACGSSDEEPAGGDADATAGDDADAATGDETGDDTSDDDATSNDDASSNDDATSNDDTGDDTGDDRIAIDDFDDIPDECVDLMADFLREIESSVSGIDWENVTIDELNAMGEAINAPTDDFDRRSEEVGCDRYDIGIDDDQSLEFVLRVAEDAAPGTVGWLQFIADMATAVDDVPSGDDADTSDPGTSDADGPPADCDGMKDYLLGLAEEYGTLTNMPAGEFAALGVAMGNLTQVCTIAEFEAIYEDPVLQAFLDG